MSRRKLPDSLVELIREDAQNRCGYCRVHQRHVPNKFHCDHIIPLAKGGTNNRDNLWLACFDCNRAKSNITERLDEETNAIAPLFNPRTDTWSEHFKWSSDGLRIIGKTATGRVTVIQVNVNNKYIVSARQFWIDAKVHPPKDEDAPWGSIIGT